MSQTMTLNKLRRHGYMMVMIGYIIELFDTIIMIHFKPSTFRYAVDPVNCSVS